MTDLGASPLGRATVYADTYDPGLLFAVERAPLRDGLAFGATLPFRGADLWTAYEVSWLDPHGKPQVGVATFVVSAHSPRIVESKSVKLYLTALNQSKFASRDAVAATLARDLSAATGAAVDAELDAPEAFAARGREELSGECLDALPLRVDTFAPEPEALIAAGAIVEKTWMTRLFRSVCPVTGQPDYASVQIRYRGSAIDPAGLLRYLVSFRRHPGFHEHCVERIFADVRQRCRPRIACGLRALHAPRRRRHQSVPYERRRAGAGERSHRATIADTVSRRFAPQGRARPSGRMKPSLQRHSAQAPVTTLTLALSKGRIFDETLPLLAAAGIVPAEDPETSRRLIIATNRPGVALLIVRATDVPTYVQHGAADLGVAGKDILLEQGGEGLYQPLDLEIARCRLVVATRRGYDWAGTVQRGARIRVATKYVRTAREHFAAKGMHTDLIKLYGSMELAPLTGLADAIVDLVSSGNTLKANDLVVVEEIMPISARLVVNPAALKLKRGVVQPLLDAMAAAVARGTRRSDGDAPMNADGLVLRRLDSTAPDFDAAFAALIAFEAAQDPAVDATVAAIVADVRARGDAALLDYTARFDRVKADSVAALEISASEMQRAYDALPAAQRDALAVAAGRVRAYHERQKMESWSYREPDGSRLGQQVTPLDRVGVYVPGGKAAYPSTVLMNVIPAHVAGVGEIVMVVPTPDGVRNPLVLAAAHLAGVSRAFAIGGAQAVAALAYGTATIPAVDKICGPGNAYVAAAKRRVFGTVGIDMVAGVSEILVIADSHRESGLGRHGSLLAGRA